MSMLAETRRKQKWSVDPRNSTWSNDDSKFGQKMMERMGWAKGKGLGKHEQGDAEHVKVKVKNNTHGLGASISQEDNWIAHQDDFNDLLAQLNNCHGQNNSETQPEEQKGFSLEEKSKASKNRVHYMKFAKGKDLSSRSATDLNCIFGKRAKVNKRDEQESGDDSDSTTGQSTSTLSMQEYFAQRMAQLKRARGQSDAAAEGSEDPKKKKKKEMETANGVREASESSKEKKRQREDDANENSAEEACEERKASKKKKKKSKKQKKHMPSETTAVEHETADEGREETVQKKSKKHKKKKRQDIKVAVDAGAC
ncbi:PIN2/TERF1-interacting telomerase inhibitor 1 [Syngnathus scovelli]|uniref:PIN2/TERF1-interacting telomerase inhibitor 1 n=1 Tax=Syngnathus scovelli TaxID=161590 RepID=UPI0021102B8D|nr:PIN2/TERF1-interacting telomerase inhibitor 1 [Syngnathus scovelli]